MPIYIATSRWFILLASGMYLSVAIALFLIAWPWWLSVGILLLLVLDYMQVVKFYGLRTHKNAIAVIIRDCDKWQYQLFSGRQYRAKLIKQRSFCSGMVLILYLKNMTGGRYVVIPRDSLSQHNYRFLALQICS